MRPSIDGFIHVLRFKASLLNVPSNWAESPDYPDMDGIMVPIYVNSHQNCKNCVPLMINILLIIINKSLSARFIYDSDLLINLDMPARLAYLQLVYQSFV